MPACTGLIDRYVYLKSWFDRRAYQPDSRVASSPTGVWAFFLFLADIVFMIRGYAVSNLVETLLFLTFLVYGPLRLEFAKTLKDPVVALLMLFSVGPFCLVSGRVLRCWLY